MCFFYIYTHCLKEVVVNTTLLIKNNNSECCLLVITVLYRNSKGSWQQSHLEMLYIIAAIISGFLKKNRAFYFY